MINLSKYLIPIFLLFSLSSIAQDFSESDVGFNGELLELENISCLDSFNEDVKENWKSNKTYRKFNKGKNILSGSLIFFGEGIAEISASSEDKNYIEAIQNAVALASLRAKKELALFREAEIRTSTTLRAMEAISSGIPVSDYGKKIIELDDRTKAYETSNPGQKFMMFIDKKLDEWIGEKSDITNDKIELRKRINNLLSQNVFKETITTLAYSEIAGMKNVKIQVKEDRVCVLSVWSQRTNRWATELGQANYEVLASLRPGKSSLSSVIPNKKNKDELKDLTGSFGLQIDVDENGELFLISYAQASAINRSANSINSARIIAENRARGQIAQFSNEAVDVYENLENIEISSTYVDETTNSYAERNFMTRTKSASRLNISGVELHDWWATIHPYTNKPVVGVIMVWQPSNALAVQNTKETNEFDDLGF